MNNLRRPRLRFAPCRVEPVLGKEKAVGGRIGNAGNYSINDRVHDNICIYVYMYILTCGGPVCGLPAAGLSPSWDRSAFIARSRPSFLFARSTI